MVFDSQLVREMMKSIVADQSHGTKNVLCNGLHEVKLKSVYHELTLLIASIIRHSTCGGGPFHTKWVTGIPAD